MNIQQVHKSIQDLADPILERYGYSSMGPTYVKKVSDALYVFIHFEVSRDRATYTIWAYPSTPKLNPPDQPDFPAQHGNPLGNKSFLNAKLGVGNGASSFSCKTEEVLQMTLSKYALPAIEKHAIPFLEKFHELPDLLPFLEHPQWASAITSA